MNWYERYKGERRGGPKLRPKRKKENKSATEKSNIYTEQLGQIPSSSAQLLLWL